VCVSVCVCECLCVYVRVCILCVFLNEPSIIRRFEVLHISITPPLYLINSIPKAICLVQRNRTDSFTNYPTAPS